MVQLGALRDSRVWQEAYMEGFQKGFLEGYQIGKLQIQQTVVRSGFANGMSAKKIANLLEISVAQVIRLAKQSDSSTP